jgi:hypothetical protein
MDFGGEPEKGGWGLGEEARCLGRNGCVCDSWAGQHMLLFLGLMVFTGLGNDARAHLAISSPEIFRQVKSKSKKVFLLI